MYIGKKKMAPRMFSKLFFLQMQRQESYINVLLNFNIRVSTQFSVTLHLIPLAFCTTSLYDESLTVARSRSADSATLHL